MLHLVKINGGFSTYQFTFLDDDCGKQLRFHIEYNLEKGSCDTELLSKKEELLRAFRVKFSYVEKTTGINPAAIEALVEKVTSLSVKEAEEVTRELCGKKPAKKAYFTGGSSETTYYHLPHYQPHGTSTGIKKKKSASDKRRLAKKIQAKRLVPPPPPF